MSHRQSRRQLAKREKALKVLQSKTEQLHSKYDELFDEYRSEQRRFEMLCTRYIQMQLKKKQQIFNLKNTLGQASECIFHAQVVIDECCHAEKSPISPENLEIFRRNLECFMDALRNCCCLRKVHELQQQQRKKEEMEKCQNQNPVDDLLTPKARERSSQEQSSDTYIQNLSNRHPRIRRYRHSAR